MILPSQVEYLKVLRINTYMNIPSQMDCNSTCAPIRCHLGFVCGSFCITIAAKMPRLRVVKSDKIKDIPCKYPHKYADSVDPIYEIHKISQNELSELSCWVTHCVKAYSTKVPENYILYNFYEIHHSTSSVY